MAMTGGISEHMLTSWSSFYKKNCSEDNLTGQNAKFSVLFTFEIKITFTFMGHLCILK